MRLIDADKLENDITENITTKAVSRVVAILQGQPTAKAITIERINSYTTGLIFSDDYADNADSIDDYIYCIKEMVRDWEKENEIN